VTLPCRVQPYSACMSRDSLGPTTETGPETWLLVRPALFQRLMPDCSPCALQLQMQLNTQRSISCSTVCKGAYSAWLHTCIVMARSSQKFLPQEEASGMKWLHGRQQATAHEARPKQRCTEASLNKHSNANMYKIYTCCCWQGALLARVPAAVR
jgi:hypothetical protein